MSIAQIEIVLIAMVVAAACALPGVFLVLRKMAMMSDAISHAILPGIVVAFFLTEDLNAPLLIIAATLTGGLTVVLVELLHRTRLVKEDAAIGLVFPLMFSIGVVLIARYAGDVHLDIDAVLLGELAFAPFDRLLWLGMDLGPKALWVMGVIFLLNVGFIAVFYKELQLTTFDAALASALGFSPLILHYALMLLVSVTAVGAFDAVGSILVVALMIGPPATAYLLTERLHTMLFLSVVLAVLAAASGYALAFFLDVSIAGAMATTTGVLFTVAWLGSPQHGLLAHARRRRTWRWQFALRMLTIHLHQHEGKPEARRENRAVHLEEHLQWTPDFAAGVISRAVEAQLVKEHRGFLILTVSGRAMAEKAIIET